MRSGPLPSIGIGNPDTLAMVDQVDAYVRKSCVRIVESTKRRLGVPLDFTLLAFQIRRDPFANVCVHVGPDEAFSNEFDSCAFTRVWQSV